MLKAKFKNNSGVCSTTITVIFAITNLDLELAVSECLNKDWDSFSAKDIEGIIRAKYSKLDYYPELFSEDVEFYRNGNLEEVKEETKKLFPDFY